MLFLHHAFWWITQVVDLIFIGATTAVRLAVMLCFPSLPVQFNQTNDNLSHNFLILLYNFIKSLYSRFVKQTELSKIQLKKRYY